jgi:excisionase family DNA binding protein
MKNNKMKSLYTLSEVAKELNVSRQAIHYKVKNGLINATKIGDRWFVKGEVLDSILKSK